MSSGPKIIVLRTREILYTVLLIFLAAVLLLCIFLMFSRKSALSRSIRQSEITSPETAMTETEPSYSTLPLKEPSKASYRPGVYTLPFSIGSDSMDLEVVLDADHINSIRLVNLSSDAAASYPLVTPALEHITAQILETQQLEGITCPPDNRYTSQLLLSAIIQILSQASAS